MAEQTILESIRRLRVWSRGDQRAPHKPLLCLYALAGFSRGQREFPFRESELSLKALLLEFGKGITPNAAYPFWRLQNDGIWEVRPADLRPRVSNTDPPVTELRDREAVGRFTAAVSEQLVNSPGMLAQTVRQLLDEHFPRSIHEDILQAIGYELIETPVNFGVRDPSFRQRVLDAYRHRCAICSSDLRLANMSVGLEAAHIKWVSHGGPNTEDNGLALCSLHHKLFDRGALTIDRDGTILLSSQLNGYGWIIEHMEMMHGQRITVPSSACDHPSPQFLKWHQTEVLRGKPRPVNEGR